MEYTVKSYKWYYYSTIAYDDEMEHYYPTLLLLSNGRILTVYYFNRFTIFVLLPIGAAIPMGRYGITDFITCSISTGRRILVIQPLFAGVMLGAKIWFIGSICRLRYSRPARRVKSTALRAVQ